VELGGLVKLDVGRCVGAILGAAALPRQDLVDSLYELTEGNPFYLEEVVKSLVQRGELLYAEGVAPVSQQSPGATQRAGCGAAAARGIGPSVRGLLSVAAVAGPHFDAATLQRVTGLSDAAFLEAVRELVGAQFLVDESAEGFSFRHALTREAIYATLLALERRRLHGAWAAAIENDPGLAASHSETLAYHWYEAQDWPKAQHFALLAAERASQLYSPKAVVAHLTKASEASRRMGLPVSFKVLLLRGQAVRLLATSTSRSRIWKPPLPLAARVTTWLKSGRPSWILAPFGPRGLPPVPASTIFALLRLPKLMARKAGSRGA